MQNLSHKAEQNSFSEKMKDNRKHKWIEDTKTDKRYSMYILFDGGTRQRRKLANSKGSHGRSPLCVSGQGLSPVPASPLLVLSWPWARQFWNLHFKIDSICPVTEYYGLGKKCPLKGYAQRWGFGVMLDLGALTLWSYKVAGLRLAILLGGAAQMKKAAPGLVHVKGGCCPRASLFPGSLSPFLPASWLLWC